MNNEDKIKIVRQAFEVFREKIVAIKKKQLALFDRIDKVISKEKADEVRNKINNN